MTKLVIILDAYQPIIGGGQELFNQIIKGLIKNHDYQITLITRALIKNKKNYSTNQSLYQNQLKIIRLGPPAKFHFLPARIWFTFQSAVFASKLKPDLFLASSFLPGITLQLIKLVNKTPNVLVAIGFGAKSKIYQWLEKLITEVFKYNLLITDDYQFYKKIKPKRNTKFITNGVTIPKQTKLKRFNQFTFLFVGRNEPRKGVDVIDRAFKTIHQKHPQVKLIKIGPGIKTVSKSKLKSLMHKSHCLVIPSLKEGHPLILFEAMAHRLPVIATSVGSIPRFVTKKNGWLIPPNNSQVLAQAMEKAIKSKQLDQIGQTNYQLVKNHHSWEKTIKKYHQSLNILLNDRSAKC